MLNNVPEILLKDLRGCDFICFDNDGTILDSSLFAYEAFVKGWETLNNKYNFGIDKPDYNKFCELIGYPWHEFYKYLLPDEFQCLRDEIHREIAKYELKELEDGKGRFYDGVEKTLTELKKRKYRMFLASNASTPYFNKTIEKLNYREYFEAFYCVGNSGLTKPELIAQAINQLNLKKGVMVGDKASDIEAGKFNNLITIGCSYGYGSKEELQKADLIIDDILELIYLF